MQNFFDTEYRIIYLYIIVFLTAFLIVWQSIPSIIYVAKRKRLLDKPSGRKKHTTVTPNLAGIALFSAFAFVCSLFQVGKFLPEWNYIFAGAFLLFVTGLKDDLVPITAYKKFLAQFGASFIIVVFADLRIENLHGFLGIYELPYLLSVALSFLIITFVTNAYNLIDGVDGLAGLQSIIGFLFLGFFISYLQGNYGLSMICFCMAGAILGFLVYNLFVSPARIFMGDTGSLQLGYLLSIMSVALIHKYQDSPLLNVSGGLGIAAAVLFIPAFDTLRVFTTRILKGKSPFLPDRTHIHHVLLDMGIRGRSLVVYLALANIVFIAFAYAMKDLNPTYTILGLLVLACITMLVLVKIRNNRMGKKSALLPVNERIIKQLKQRDEKKRPYSSDKTHKPASTSAIE